MLHYSVLKNELIAGLNIKDNGIYVDATIGYAGDSKEILKKIKNGYLYGFDQDDNAVNYSNEELKKISNNFKIFKSNFVNMKELLNDNNVQEVDGIIFDLGFSSPQIDDEKRGFSFMHDGPLDMRMSNDGISAKDIIDRYSEEELTKIFFQYGEEKLSKVIAKKIVSKKELTSIFLPSGLKEIYESFSQNNLTKVDLSQLTNLEYISSYAFCDNNISKENFIGIGKYTYDKFYITTCKR